VVVSPRILVVHPSVPAKLFDIDMKLGDVEAIDEVIG